MEMTKKCEYCNSIFHANRRNQKYCTSSCRTMACYERNEYEYQSGYKKPLESKKNPLELKNENPLNGIPQQKTNTQDIINTAVGTGLALGVQSLAKNLLIDEKDKTVTNGKIEAFQKEVIKLFQIELKKQDDYYKKIMNQIATSHNINHKSLEDIKKRLGMIYPY